MPEVNDRASWSWEETDPSRSGSSGDLSKLFRHEVTKNPGVMAVGAPSANATVMAREVIQNSWDAARELQGELADEGHHAPPFHIDFEYRNVEGAAKAELAKRLDLSSLAEHARGKDLLRLGLHDGDCLAAFGTPDPLPLLIVKERASSGMYGPFTGARSKMYLALVTIGYTGKQAGSGGSYGYGKAGLIRASATRTVVAYTCFRERDDDPGVTRRLLGMTYWGQHEHDDASCTGFARFAAEGDRPFENEAADRIAASLGLDVRNHERVEDLGTTFLLLAPTIGPEDLVRAIERSWWPALVDREFTVTVTTKDGQPLHPRPRLDATLGTFVRAYEIATTSQDNTKEDEKRYSFNAFKAGNESYPEPGHLGLVSDREGWSYADHTTSAASNEPTVDHRSLVALIRGPKMVVEYWEAGRTPPYVRGAFVAGKSVDDRLRWTEPKAHDAWVTTAGDGDLDPDATAVAKTILERIRERVAQFRKSLKPPTPPPDDIHLPLFDDIMRKMLSGDRKGIRPPPGDTRPVRIHLSQTPEPVGADTIRLTGSARLSLSEHHDADEAEVDVEIGYRFVEDDRAGTSCPLLVIPPPGFAALDGKPGQFRGTLVRDQDAAFQFRSDPYAAAWTGRLSVVGDVRGPHASEDEA